MVNINSYLHSSLKIILDICRYAAASYETIGFATINRLPVADVFISHEHKVKKQPHSSFFVSFETNIKYLDVFKGSLTSNPNRVQYSFRVE